MSNLPSSGLTRAHVQILAAIRRVYLETGLPPSVPELMEEFGYRSPRLVSRKLALLVERGYLVVLGKSPGYVPVAKKGFCPCCQQRLP
jgi:SOS-response transcriptional repressor LexA